MKIDRKILDDFFNSFQRAGMAVAYKNSFIYTKFSNSININSIFNIGSISKVFTAVAVLILQDMGKIELDEKVVKYLPNFRMKDPRYKKITIRMLLNHSSGLRGTSFTGAFGYSFCEVVDLFFKNLKNSNLQYDPGFIRIYCDDGFFLAQVLIEEVSGLSFCDFVEKYISQKIGLKNTGKSVGQLSNNLNIVPCFKDHVSLPLEFSSVYGIAGLSSSLNDLCKFAFALYNGQILSTKTQKELFSPQKYISMELLQDNLCFGMPWDFINRNIFMKQGNTSQYASLFLVIPRNNVSIAFFTPTAEFVKIDQERILSAFPECYSSKNFFAFDSTPNFNILDFLGIYANKYDIFKMEYGKAKRNLIFTSIISKQVKHFKQIKENCFLELSSTSKKQIFSFKEVYDKKYFSEFDSLHGFNMLKFEKFNMPEYKMDFDFVRDELDNKLWFRINGDLYEIAPARNNSHITRAHIIKSKVYKEFQIIDFENLKKFVSKNKAIPLCLGRGQSELNFIYNTNHFEKGGIKLAKLNGRIYTPYKNIWKFSPNFKSITSNQQVKWLEISGDYEIKMLNKSRGRILVFSNELAIIYDSLINNNECYLTCHGVNFIEFLEVKHVDVFHPQSQNITVIAS